MTARPEFGAAIEVGGVRPSWLPDDVEFAPYRSGHWGASWHVARNVARWDRITAIRLEVPRYDFVYLALERGMVPWFGGDEAPGDWDGGSVLVRTGEVLDNLNQRCWNRPYHAGNMIIGYTSTARALPHTAAQQGGAE